MKKKTNPYRMPVTMANVERAKKEASADAIRRTQALFLTVLRDKEGYDIEGLQRVWNEIEDLSDSVINGYCTISDLRDVLKQEEGVELT